jgi:hypothetical protein
VIAGAGAPLSLHPSAPPSELAAEPLEELLLLEEEVPRGLFSWSQAVDALARSTATVAMVTKAASEVGLGLMRHYLYPATSA